MKTAFLIALGSALVTVAGPAFAQERAVQVVTTGDLNLSQADGQRRLAVRLARAAREVCGSASDADLRGRNEVRACRAETLAAARASRDQLLARADRGGMLTVTAAR